MKISDSGHNVSLFEALALFRSVDIEDIEEQLNRCTRMDLSAGELLLSPEKENNAVYIVLSGCLQVHLDSLDNTPLTELGLGTCAGEMSIIEGKKPSAYVVASEDTHLMVISNELLWEFVSASHAFSRNLLIVLSQRVRLDNEVILDSVGILRQFERNAITDALTDLHNRHWMQDMFRRMINRSRQDGEEMCLVMLDVDYFKRYNDEYGHLAGDHALCHVAQVLRTQFRPTDLIARFGGDEFAILLPDADLEASLPIAERVCNAIDKPFQVDPKWIVEEPVTVSVGVAQMTENDTLESLLHNADSALYRAKLKGRNCVSD